MPEASGVAGHGSAFGVTPSISSRPPGQTTILRNSSFTPAPPSESDADNVVGSWERQMSYLENVINERPMLRVAASVIVAFCFAAPLVWVFSNLVVYGLRSVI